MQAINHGNEVLNIFLVHLESKYLGKTALVSKAWFDKVKATLLSRQRNSLPESFRALEGKKFTIYPYFGDGYLSLQIDPTKTIFKLHSLEQVNSGYEEYSLLIDEGEPLKLDSSSSEDGHNTIFGSPALNLFFSTIEKSLSEAKISYGRIKITGLDRYLTKEHWRISRNDW